MATNRGKEFEQRIKEAFEKVDGVSIDRLHDQTTGYLGSANICDFIVYKEPYEYYIECKSVHGNTLPFSNITDTQWRGLLEKSKIKGVTAGVICWWIDKDVTLFIPIQILQKLKLEYNRKSIRYDNPLVGVRPDEEQPFVRQIEIKGTKKRVFFDYDMKEFFNDLME